MFSKFQIMKLKMKKVKKDKMEIMSDFESLPLCSLFLIFLNENLFKTFLLKKKGYFTFNKEIICQILFE